MNQYDSSEQHEKPPCISVYAKWCFVLNCSQKILAYFLLVTVLS